MVCPFSMLIRVRTFISAPLATCRWVKPRLVLVSRNLQITVSALIIAIPLYKMVVSAGQRGEADQSLCKCYHNMCPIYWTMREHGQKS